MIEIAVQELDVPVLDVAQLKAFNHHIPPELRVPGQHPAFLRFGGVVGAHFHDHVVPLVPQLQGQSQAVEIQGPGQIIQVLDIIRNFIGKPLEPVGHLSPGVKPRVPGMGPHQGEKLARRGLLHHHLPVVVEAAGAVDIVEKISRP